MAKRAVGKKCSTTNCRNYSAAFVGQNAAALSSYFRINENVVVSGGLSYGVEAKQVGGRAGMLFAW